MSAKPASKLKATSNARPTLSTASSSTSEPPNSISPACLSPTTTASTSSPPPLSPTRATTIPNPLAIFTHHRSSSQTSNTTERLRSKSPLSLKPCQTSPTHPAPPHRKNRRTISEPAISPLEASKRNSIGKKPKSPPDSTAHCGRHGNEWLFGGFSVRETVKKALFSDEDEKGK